MSVLKQKRTTSKAEFINTANLIYVETLNFLTRLEARASLMALDVRLTHVYLILNQNPEGAFTTSKGNPVKSQDAMEKLDKMAQNLGELIDKENELLKGAIKNVTAKQK